MAIILPSNSASASFEITNSLQFDRADSAKLTRTPSSATNQKTYTLSSWVKTFTSNANKSIFSCGQWPSEPYSVLQFDGTSTLRTTFRVSAVSYVYVNGALGHDWNHIVWAVDTTDSTQDNRLKLYVNGTLLTSFVFVNKLAQNIDTGVNATHIHSIGNLPALNYVMDGLMTEMHFIDGSQLAPTDFAVDDSGTWKAKQYTGSYGTNGFYMRFSDSSDIGKDSSGNGNHFTPVNLASSDVKTDVPPFVS